MNKYKLLSRMAVLLLIISLPGCNVAWKGNESGVEKTIFVGPYKTDCVGVAPQKCYRIKENVNDEWSYYYDDIEGFDYEEGFIYKLKIEEQQIENPPADGPSIKLKLVSVINKTEASFDPDSGEAQDIVNKQWTLKSLGPVGAEDTVVPQTSITIEFSSERKFHGVAGCNRYFGGYEAGKNNSISFGNIGSTKMMCPEKVMEQENRFFEALQNTTRFRAAGQQLQMFYDNGKQVINFVENLPEDSGEKYSVKSFTTLSFEQFNEGLSDAANKGKSWVRDPIRIALEFMGSKESPRVDIQREDEGGEAANSTTVTVVEDGYLDDSVRGTWTRYKMMRLDDGTWRVVDIQRAYRCWRGQHQDSYSAQLCP